MTTPNLIEITCAPSPTPSLGWLVAAMFGASVLAWFLRPRVTRIVVAVISDLSRRARRIITGMVDLGVTAGVGVGVGLLVREASNADLGSAVMFGLFGAAATWLTNELTVQTPNIVTALVAILTRITTLGVTSRHNGRHVDGYHDEDEDDPDVPKR